MNDIHRPPKSGEHRSDLWPRRPSCLPPMGGFTGARECPLSDFGRGDDTVGNPHRAQISQFDFFELILFSKLDKPFPVVSKLLFLCLTEASTAYMCVYIYIYIYIYMYVCVHSCTYLCVYIYIYTYIYTHIYT